MIVGVTMDVFAIMVECTLVMIVTIQVSHSEYLTCNPQDGTPFRALYFLVFCLISECADRIMRDQDACAKQET